MSKTIPEASQRESLVFFVAHFLPYYLRGIFRRNRFWHTLWSRFHPDPLGLRFFATLRYKYQSDYLYVRALRARMLLVFGRPGIQHVLENSPHIYVAGKIKRIGMSHFQPHALTISHGDEWAERRAFNEAILQSDQRIHAFADHFLAIIHREVHATNVQQAALTWHAFSQLFERIAQQILFGTSTPAAPLAHNFARLMRQSNRVVGLRPNRDFESFYRHLGAILANPDAMCLAGSCQSTPATARTRVANQIPHWIFAMQDTLAENVVPALALIVAHPEAEARVRQELTAADLTTPQGIDSLRFLEACIQEAMRLWPTTPLIARQSTVAGSFDGITIPGDTAIVILNSFTHRDEKYHPAAHRFAPEIWLDDDHPPHFNHFGGGPQRCAGQSLALFIAKGVLATLLQANRFRLKRPVLHAQGSMPPTFDPFRARFERVP